MSDLPEPQTVSYHATAAAPLVSLAIAKEQLRITDADHDAEITRMSHEATDVILDYLKHGADPAWTPETVPLPVQAAILRMLSHLYADRGDREAKETDASADEKVWAAIDRLLARFRDPALA
jgi:hypothetical protein